MNGGTCCMQAITLLVIRTGFDRLLDGPVNYAATVVAASLACARPISQFHACNSTSF